MAKVTPVKFVSNVDFEGWRLPFSIADTYDAIKTYPAPHDTGWVTRPQVFFVSKGQFEYLSGTDVYSVTDQTPYRKWGTAGAYQFTCVSNAGETICLTPVGMSTGWSAERVVIAADATHSVSSDISRQYVYVTGTATVNGISVTDDLVSLQEGEGASVVAGPDGCQIMHIHSPETFDMQYSETRPAEISEPIR